MLCLIFTQLNIVYLTCETRIRLLHEYRISSWTFDSNQAAPAVTKAAAVSFAEWLKITYGSNGIGVTCLCPQAVRTAMTANGPGVAGVDGMIEPEECAAEVLDAIVNERFLAAPHKEVLE